MVAKTSSSSSSLLLLLLLLQLLSASASASAQPDCRSGFSSGAASAGSRVRYRAKRLQGKESRDVTRAEVTWRPMEMLESDLDCFDLEQTELLFRTSSDSTWRAVEEDMRSEGRVSARPVSMAPI